MRYHHKPIRRELTQREIDDNILFIYDKLKKQKKRLDQKHMHENGGIENDR